MQTVSLLPITPIKARPNRMLLIRPDHVGDVLLATPAIQALREALPYTQIHALVGPWSAQVLVNYDAVDAVLTLPFPGFGRHEYHSRLVSPYMALLTASRHLRRIGYSSALVMRPDHWWGAMLAFLAGIPHRVGYDLPGVSPFLTELHEHRHEHAVVQNLRLVERWTGPLEIQQTPLTFPVQDEDRAYVDGYLETWKIAPGQRVICIHPGSGTWVKLWRTENWARVADTLTEQLDAPVVFTGSDHELPLVLEITAQMQHRACIMVGDTRLGQLGALFSRARVVLGPDSGPLHLAVACGAPTVTLFGPADPVEFGPWGPRERHAVVTMDIGCRPCRVLDWGDDSPENHPCVREITVGQVLNAARRAANPG